MFQNSEELLKYVKDEGVEMVDIRFCDLPGVMQHFTVPVSSFDQSVFDDGLSFDGSSIRGFQEIHESDMLLLPDPTTAPPDEKPAVVPDVVGMTEATARMTITNAGLTPQVRYGTATGPCVVLSQFPKAGTQVQPQAVVGIELPRPTGECAIVN